MAETREQIMESFRTNPSAMPKPESDAELEVLSELYFGAPLHLSKLGVCGNEAYYEVREPHNYVAEQSGYHHYSTAGYDFAGQFWGYVVGKLDCGGIAGSSYVVGKLDCGGIAGSSYGQVRVDSHRQKKRLERWVQNRRRNESGRLRKPFARLARHCRGEREQGDSR